MNRLDELITKKENLIMRATLNEVQLALCKELNRIDINDEQYDRIFNIVTTIGNTRRKLDEN